MRDEEHGYSLGEREADWIRERWREADRERLRADLAENKRRRERDAALWAQLEQAIGLLMRVRDALQKETP